mmetsp:Transcript_11711/g.17179  ORF Transcript_11711/g.17179 Transcript_11711/m.17179 type:complete len:279 (+) Transcript_11711:39-875(+)|eukprot:CAMPEP_0194239338 /NCGR_PEP_ID=MMETSP0158-20130606/5835_1 /TAXON_ID=33649 /ORGANISM="Thalassionema nitzschioides, Strain L26-B" /LENGTH=278 /DNA_ID=CAMNT_0038973793 /DNA_START=40 /DNA_END=876 /DNA_ORIENTATION=-
MWRKIALLTILAFTANVFTAASEAKQEKLKDFDHVIVSIAMEAEATPLVDHLELKEDKSAFPPQVPFRAYSGSICDSSTKITVITSGKDIAHETGVDNVGTVPAALSAYLALQNLPDADILINAGTAGGFGRKGAEIGDVFLTTAVANHDRRISIPVFTPYGVGKLNSVVDTATLASRNNFKTGICTTGNSLEKTPEDEKHMLENDASVKDMEAAAIAWSCELHGIPFVGLKVVTDIVDGDVPAQDEFMENLSTASKSLQAAVPKLLESMCSDRHVEL